MTKPFVKRTAGHFRNLIDHSLKGYEPSPLHLMKRLLRPLCLDIQTILDEGTAADAKEALTLFRQECARLAYE